MVDYFVCSKDCTYAGQRWYPGDKMPASYSKDGKCPPHFVEPEEYKQRKAEEKQKQHEAEVKARFDEMRTDDPATKKLTQKMLNKTLGTKDAVVPDKPLAETWDEVYTKPSLPPVAGPQPGSTVDSKIAEKRGPGRPPKYDR